MSKKKQIIALCVIVTLVTILQIAIPLLVNRKKMLSPADESMVVVSTTGIVATVKNTMITSAEDVIDNDLSLHGYNTISEADDTYYPFKVMLVNIQDLASTTLPSSGANSLEEYLHRYVTYYKQIEEPYWKAEYIKGSYEGDAVFPTFSVILHAKDEDIKIKCTYNTSTKRYHFSSVLNEANS